MKVISRTILSNDTIMTLVEDNGEPCKIPGCQNRYHGDEKTGFGFCKSHYKGYWRWRLKTRMLKRLDPEMRCRHCHGTFGVAAMDFHHIHTEQKNFAVSEAIGRGRKQEEIEEEVDKCWLLCSNCHRIHENGRLEPLYENFYRTGRP